MMLGGQGLSADPFGGRAFPCFPGGGDVFGCWPCGAPHPPPDVSRFVSGAAPFVDPRFFSGYFQSQTPKGHYVSQSIETAASAKMAPANRAAFIASPGASRGKGD